MRKLGWWAHVEAALARGEVPRIDLPRAAKVIIPKRPTGRPRIYPEGQPRPHHRGHRMLTPGGHPLRCRWRFCRRMIPKDREALTCCDRCEHLLREFLETTLDVLDGKMPAAEYPAHYRSWRIA